MSQKEKYYTTELPLTLIIFDAKEEQDILSHRKQYDENVVHTFWPRSGYCVADYIWHIQGGSNMTGTICM
jgi:hypothetical protein